MVISSYNFGKIRLLSAIFECYIKFGFQLRLMYRMTYRLLEFFKAYLVT